MQQNVMQESFSAEHIHCEVYGGDWRGPNKRGRAILGEIGPEVPVLPPRQAVTFLQERFPEHFEHIEALIFYPQAVRDQANPGRWLPFIGCYTRPRFVARKRLFDLAEEVARATGWYLLVSGRYLHRQGQVVPGAFQHARALTAPRGKQSWGKLRRVRSISGPGNGTAMLVEMDGLILQLDTGFQDPGAAADLVFVSHAHADHSGGIDGALHRAQPVLISEATYQLLRGKERWSWADSLGVVRPGFHITSPDGGRLEWLTGYHSNDAVMLRLTDAEGQQLLYTGDFCLGNGFFRERPEELCRLFDPGASRSLLLTDACFWGRPPLREAGPDLRQLEKEVHQAITEGRNVVFAASSADYLYPLYLWFFRRFNSGSANARVPTVLSMQLHNMLHSGYRAYTLDKRHAQDVYVRHVMNHSFATYLGSVHVYAPSELRHIAAHGQKAVTFVLQADLDLVPSDATCFVLGNGQRDDTRTLLTACRRFQTVQPLFGRDFSFHSCSEDVEALFRHVTAAGIDVLAFHADADQVRRAARRLPVEAGQIAHIDDFDWSWGFKPA